MKQTYEETTPPQEGQSPATEQETKQNEQAAPEEFFFKSSTGIDDIHAVVWNVDNPRAIIQICHGMAEHILRYDEFARFLNGQGFLVYGHDHLGHGQSIREGIHGFFALHGGWDYLVQDVHVLRKTMQAKYPKLPCILFGHSMGSFIARDYTARFGQGLRGAIYCGTSGGNAGTGIGKLLASIANPLEENPRIYKLAFSAYNHRFNDSSNSDFAWISSDEEQIRLYEEDPLCGFRFTARGYFDLFDGLSRVSRRGWAKRLPNIPILLIAGSDDPVGDFSMGVKKVHQRLKRANKRVETKIYDGMRHEILNETDRQRVYDDIAHWLNTHCGII